MTNKAATKTTTTDPAAEKPYETAAFSEGEGASDGGAEIDDGGTEEEGEDADDGEGDGGELTAESGDGETVSGDLDGETAGEVAAAFGDDAGDCATAEKTNIAATMRMRVKDEAIRETVRGR
ncbi:hypothetical protein LR48_Vigan09g261700 [Vigna angularis]|uniref:Uncharacterized protein n=1 Tax=Phaseolus angularis TaxID=3914 RepID=A0A0L9VG45_PHAAN|nr:hypothetical protein LR48_Vigan09g261700 [Vigna angularis]